MLLLQKSVYKIAPKYCGNTSWRNVSAFCYFLFKLSLFKKQRKPSLMQQLILFTPDKISFTSYTKYF